MSYTTLEQMIEKAEELASECRDYTAEPVDHYFEGGACQYILDQQPEKQWFSVEDKALGQIATRLNIPVQYLRRCGPELRADNLNWWMERQPDGKEWFVRTDGDNVRAFLSQSYTPIDNLECLLMINQFVQEMDYKLVRPVLERDIMHLRVLLPDLDGVGPEEGTGRGNYGMGFYASNGETGGRSVIVAPLLQRTSCTNSTVWLEGGWKQRHVHHSTGFLRNAFQEAIGQAIKASDHLLEQVAAAERVNIPDPRDIVRKLVEKHGLTEDEHNAVLFGMEGSSTALGVVNGITWMAKNVDDQQVKAPHFEALAGAILAEPESLMGRMANYQLSYLEEDGE